MDPWIRKMFGDVEADKWMDKPSMTPTEAAKVSFVDHTGATSGLPPLTLEETNLMLKHCLRKRRKRKTPD